MRFPTLWERSAQTDTFAKRVQPGRRLKRRQPRWGWETMSPGPVNQRRVMGFLFQRRPNSMTRTGFPLEDGVLPFDSALYTRTRARTHTQTNLVAVLHGVSLPKGPAAPTNPPRGLAFQMWLCKASMQESAGPEDRHFVGSGNTRKWKLLPRFG